MITAQPKKRLPRFPGLYRPGLIGAAVEFDAYMRTGKGFRGFTAPASLEPRPKLFSLSLQPGFRGFTAPASLEPTAPTAAHLPSRRFPGLYRPGLIGAVNCQCNSRGASLVSGALPPRPHWSGSASSTGRRKASAVSGALPPRPHWSA